MKGRVWWGPNFYRVWDDEKDHRGFGKDERFKFESLRCVIRGL